HRGLLRARAVLHENWRRGAGPLRVREVRRAAQEPGSVPLRAAALIAPATSSLTLPRRVREIAFESRTDLGEPRRGERWVGREEDPGHLRRVDAVIAAPLASVRLAQRKRHSAQGGLPRSAVAA